MINTNFHQFGNQKQRFGAVLMIKLHFFHQIGPHRPQNNEWPNQEAQLVPFEMLFGYKKAIIGLLVEPISKSRHKMKNLDLSQNFVNTYFL